MSDYLNLSSNDYYIFQAVSSGINIYNKNKEPYGFIEVFETSCVYADNDYIYIGTTASGILITTVSGVDAAIFTDLSSFAEYPILTSNNIRCINGAGDYLSCTTSSGVDSFNLQTAGHYSCVSSKEITKCFQTSTGDLYYISKDFENTFYNYGIEAYEITLTSQVGSYGYQVKLTLDSSNFSYDNTLTSGSNFVFIDSNYNVYPYFVETWNTEGTSVVWVYVNKPSVISFYMLLDSVPNNLSDFNSVFYFYNDFTTNSDAWTYSDNAVVYNHYLLFDGVNDYVSLNSLLPTISGTDFTVEFYFKTDSRKISIDTTIFTIESVSGVSKFTLCGYNSSYCAKLMPATVAGSRVIFDSLWHYIAVVYNSGSVIVYVDGQKDIDVEYTFNIEPTDYFTLGADYTGYTYHYYFEQCIRNFAIWNYAKAEETLLLDSKQIYTGLEEGLIAYYSCNQASGTVMYDSTGSYNQTIVGATWVDAGTHLISGTITSPYSIDIPCTIEQDIKFIDGSATTYSIALLPQEEGVSWVNDIPGRTYTVKIGPETKEIYNPINNMPMNEYGSLSISILYNKIKFKFQYGNTILLDNWSGNTYNNQNRAIQLSGMDVQLYNTKIKIYDAFDPTVKSIVAKPTILVKKNKLNSIYSVDRNWTDSSVDYFYTVDDGVVLHDLYVTENTSIYSGSNVLFIASSDGIICIEERKNNELNCRKKYYKNI